MKRLMLGATLLALLTSPAAIARPDAHSQSTYGQQHQGRQWQPQPARSDNGRHNARHNGWGRDRGANANWGRGQRMGYNDWRTAQRVDYRRYHLRQPPRGYEWRRSNDRFVLAAVASGLIISVILSSGR